MSENEKHNKFYFLLPVFILLAATFLRLFELPTLPPGLNFDEAGNGVAAVDILRGTPKLWWPIGGGKEPVWPYIIAVSTSILGNIPLALRLPAAFAGILTTAAVYPFTLALFRGVNNRRLIALLTMLGLALSGWHLHFSRLGFRAILLPLLSTVGFYLFWHALTAKQYKQYVTVLSSFLITLAIYSYLAARLLPFVIILFWFTHKIRHRKTTPPYFRFFAPLLLIFLFLTPLIIYFIFNPADFIARSAAVSIFNPNWNNGNLPGAIWQTFALTISTFLGLGGDTNPLVNLPGQPALPIFIAPFFILGFIISLYHYIRPISPTPSPYLFLLCWWGIMLIPAILAPEGAPHHLRLIGTIVPTYALIAVGLTTVARLIRPAYLLPIVLYTLLAFQTYTSYFNQWPNSTDFTLPFDLYATRLAAEIEQTVPDSGYVLPMDIRAGREARHYTLDYLLADNAPYTYIPVDEQNAEKLLTTAVAGKNQLYVVRWTQDKHHAADEKEIITYLLETSARLDSRQSFPVYDLERYILPDNKTKFTLPEINQPVSTIFDGLLRIDTAFVPPTVIAGRLLPVAITVAPIAPMEADYKASLRLIGQSGERIAQKDRTLRHNFHQGTSIWPPETVNEYYLLPIPPETPPGEYTVVVVIYHPDTKSPLVSAGLVELPLGTVRVE